MAPKSGFDESCDTCDLIVDGFEESTLRESRVFFSSSIVDDFKITSLPVGHGLRMIYTAISVSASHAHGWALACGKRECASLRYSGWREPTRGRSDGVRDYTLLRLRIVFIKRAQNA